MPLITFAWNEGFEQMQGSLFGYEDWHNDLYIQVAQANVDAHVDGAARRFSLLLVAESKAETSD